MHLKINVLGTMYPTRAVLGGMKERGQGRILFTSSMAGQTGTYGYTSYAASKFALRGLAESLQMEVKCHGVAVSVSYPPDTDTPGFEEENKVKSHTTKVLSEEGGVFSSQRVASDMLKGMRRGDFAIVTGFDGWLLSLVTAGFGPCFSVTTAICQIGAASVLRFVSLLYQWKFYRFVAGETRRAKQA
ncbi:unnamed protein product [Chrysoparadoxa australica]